MRTIKNAHGRYIDFGFGAGQHLPRAIDLSIGELTNGRKYKI